MTGIILTIVFVGFVFFVIWQFNTLKTMAKYWMKEFRRWRKSREKEKVTEKELTDLQKQLRDVYIKSGDKEAFAMIYRVKSSVAEEDFEKAERDARKYLEKVGVEIGTDKDEWGEGMD